MRITFDSDKKTTIGGVILVVIAAIVIMGLYSCDEMKKNSIKNRAKEENQLNERIREESEKARSENIRATREKIMKRDFHDPVNPSRVDDIVKGRVKPKYYDNGKLIPEGEVDLRSYDEKR